MDGPTASLMERQINYYSHVLSCVLLAPREGERAFAQVNSFVSAFLISDEPC